MIIFSVITDLGTDSGLHPDHCRSNPRWSIFVDRTGPAIPVIGVCSMFPLRLVHH